MFAGLASPTHLLLLLAIILLVFGAKRLPEMGRSLGRGMQEFNAGLGSKEKPEEDNKENPTRAIEAKKQESKKRTQAVVEEKENASMVGSDVIETLVSSSPQGRGLMWLWRKL